MAGYKVAFEDTNLIWHYIANDYAAKTDHPMPA